MKTLELVCHKEMSVFSESTLLRNNIRRKIINDHLWISVGAEKETASSFSRVERLSVCLSILFLAMVSNAMWYEKSNSTQDSSFSLGPFVVSVYDIYVSIATSIIVVPPMLIITQLFVHTKRKSAKVSPAFSISTDNTNELSSQEEVHTSRKSSKISPTFGINTDDTDEQSSQEELCTLRKLSLGKSSKISPVVTNDTNDVKHKLSSRKDSVTKTKSLSKASKGRRTLPHYLVYVAWTLIFLSVVASGFFTILYAISWGSAKSTAWLLAFLLSFIESIVLIQPIKVFKFILIQLKIILNLFL